MDNLEHWIERAMAECDGAPDILATGLQIKAMTALGIRVSTYARLRRSPRKAMAGSGTEQGVGRDWFLAHTGRPPESQDTAREVGPVARRDRTGRARHPQSRPPARA